MHDSEIEGWILTSGGGLAGIDVADNDHVDVHLLLTADSRRVSKVFIKIECIASVMRTTEGRWRKDRTGWLTHPMMAVLRCSGFVCGVFVSLSKRWNLLSASRSAGRLTLKGWRGWRGWRGWKRMDGRREDVLHRVIA